MKEIELLPSMENNAWLRITSSSTDGRVPWAGGHLTPRGSLSQQPPLSIRVCSTLDMECVQSGEATSPKSHSSAQNSEDGNTDEALSGTWAASLPQFCALHVPPCPTQEEGIYNSTHMGDVMINFKNSR